MITFDAIGRPQPQGSAKAFVNKRTGRAIVTSDNAGLKFWRTIVAEAARKAMEGQPLIDRPTAICLEMTVRLKRPTSLPKRHIEATKKPDLDKIARSCLDGMAGVIYADDAQVTDLNIRKRYCLPGEQPGVHVELLHITEDAAKTIAAQIAAAQRPLITEDPEFVQALRELHEQLKSIIPGEITELGV